MQTGNDIAFDLLCGLIETDEGQLHPDAARYSGQMQAYRHLLELGALGAGDGVGTDILCPWCGGAELQAIRFDNGHYRGYCTGCGEVELAAHQLKPLRVDFRCIVRWLSAALGLAGRYPYAERVPGRLWRLGEMEHRRKRRTLFFGRRLADPALAPTIERALCSSCAPGCGVIVTTTPDEALIGAPLGHRLVPLRALAHLRKAGFVIENLDAYLNGTAVSRKPSFETSLRLMHSARIALIDGEPHRLSPQVYRFLSVLAAAEGEPVHKRTVADELEINVDTCKGADLCKRHKAVYRTFVGHDATGHYWLQPAFVTSGERR